MRLSDDGEGPQVSFTKDGLGAVCLTDLAGRFTSEQQAIMDDLSCHLHLEISHGCDKKNEGHSPLFLQDVKHKNE